MTDVQVAKKPMKERLFPPFPTIVKPKGNDTMKNEDDDMLTDNFDSRSECELDMICNMVSVIHIEFNQITEVTEADDDYVSEELANHKPLYYYVMNNGCVEEENSIFGRPD